jgi:hypothetical protein
MAQGYTTFKKFPNAGQARSLQGLLIENGIECLFINNSSQLDSSFSGELLKEYEVQLKPEDFERAEKFLEDYTKNMFNGVEEDYYLLSFTDEELYEVVLKKDEWSEFDYLLARKLLSERGKAIDDEQVKALRKQRLEELAKPESNHRGWIIAGYIMAFAGGFFGIITGYVISSSKKTLPNGNVVHTYTPEDRAHGRIIFMIGIIILPIAITYKLWKRHFEYLS